MLRDKLPSWLFFFLKRQYVRVELALQFFSDWRRFVRYSFNSDKFRSDSNLIYLITMAYHSIEKGLSHTNVRLGFGQGVVKELLRLLNAFHARNLNQQHVSYKASIDTLNKYVNLHEDAKFDIDQPLRWLMENGKRDRADVQIGGYIWKSREEILSAIHGDYKEFTLARHSVREYDQNIEVDKEAINRALELAIRVPSACNRQASKAYVIYDKKLWPIIKKYLNGARTFIDDTPCFIAITNDYQAFDKHSERNAGYIDGGIFANGVIQALTYEGLATCMLNTSMPLRHTRKLKQALGIPKSENLIVFIAVGHYIENFKVNCSARLSIDEYTKYVGN